MKINADAKGTEKGREKVELAKDEVTDISIRPGKVFRVPRYQPCSTLTSSTKSLSMSSLVLLNG